MSSSACSREMKTRLLGAYSVAAAAWLLAGCGSGGGSADESSTVTVAGEVPVAYVKRPASIRMNPTNGAPSGEGGDLIIREKSSASAQEHNITAVFTQGKGDASDPEVSYDGQKIIFSMRCPTSNTSTVNGAPACTGRWNIWEYDMSTGGFAGGTLRRLTSSTQDDDVDPAYLPAGKGFVFASNRQTKSFANQALGRSYYALDEYERERVFNLHTMDAEGGAITQISFNQSHDRNPVVRPNGDIMFSRWDHVGGRNHFKVFRIKPDGTDLFVLYGAHSEGNSFLHPRDMDPKGKYKGFITSDLMPLSGTDEGGALVFVDAQNYSEQNTPANSTIPVQGGQSQPTQQMLLLDRGLSMYGRITSPYPLWDGTDRVLAAFRPCEVMKNGVATACANLTTDEIALLNDETRTREQQANDPVQDNAPPIYSIYMFDPAQQTWLIVASPTPGSSVMYTDPVPLQSRTEPSTTEPTNVDPALATRNMGLLEVRSVYDTDGLGRMGDTMLSAADLPSGCTTAIPKTTPTDPLDTRAQVADLVKMKDPADPAYLCAPARFVRAVRAVAPPSSTMGLRSSIGETEFEPQQIIGYAPIEPDGSFKLEVPADMPIALAVVDDKGRAFQTHTNWIQVRPGERRTCDGCHSPRRGGALNSGAIVNAVPAALKAELAGSHQSGETMASTLTRVDPTALQLVSDMIYADRWADTNQPGVTARASIDLRYTSNGGVPVVPTNGIINYSQHIQPLWDRDRGANTCVTCHASASRIDLTASITGTGRTASYERLMLGDPVIDPDTGLPQVRLDEGVPMIVRDVALVDTGASEGDAVGLARKSRLTEILSGDNLMAGEAARRVHPTPAAASAPNHATMLNAAEKRLLSEWMDLGGKYYNDPFGTGSAVRTVTALSQQSFEAQVLPIMRTTCAAGCHQAIGSTNIAAGTNFRDNRLVLTGDPEGDYNVTLSMITNVCSPDANALLIRPSTAPHPAGALGQTTPPLPMGSPNYNALRSWIASGCATP